MKQTEHYKKKPQLENGQDSIDEKMAELFDIHDKSHVRDEIRYIFATLTKSEIPSNILEQRLHIAFNN